MPDLEAFEALVKQKIKLLASKDARTRRQAAAWLGEAGDPTAVTSLAQAYKNDPDTGVRETARYSLGMFRKLEQELDGPDQERVVRLLQDVALKGKMGGRPAIAVRSLTKLALGLLLSAILVAALSFVLPSIIKPGSAGSPAQQTSAQPTSDGSVSDKDRVTLLNDIRQTWTSLGGDAGTLLTQFQDAQKGTAISCTAFLNNPQAYALSANNRSSYADIAELVDLLNKAQATLSTAEMAFEKACDAGGKMSADDAGKQIAALQTMMNDIPTIGQKLVAAESQATPAPQPTTASAATVPAQAAPTVQPTAAVNIHQDIVALQTIIDNMNASDGPNSRLHQYWTDSRTPTGTAGCNDQIPASAIPADYVIPADAQSNGNFTLAANLVNTGLQAIRQGRDLFASSCPSPAASADNGLSYANAATTAFTNASGILTSLRAANG